SKGGPVHRFSVRRLWPLAAIALIAAAIYGAGLHREISFETLVRHRAVIDGFVAAHESAAVAAFVGLYIAVAALSIPAGAVLTTIGGFLFGAVTGGLAPPLGAPIRATLIFLIAQSAVRGPPLRPPRPRAAHISA